MSTHKHIPTYTYIHTYIKIHTNINRHSYIHICIINFIQPHTHAQILASKKYHKSTNKHMHM